MSQKKKNDAMKKSSPTRREVLVKGAKLMAYAVPVIDSVMVGIAEAAPQGSRGGPWKGDGLARGRPSCPPGQVMRFDQCFPVPRGNAGSGTGKNDIWR